MTCFVHLLSMFHHLPLIFFTVRSSNHFQSSIAASPTSSPIISQICLWNFHFHHHRQSVERARASLFFLHLHPSLAPNHTAQRQPDIKPWINHSAEWAAAEKRRKKCLSTWRIRNSPRRSREKSQILVHFFSIPLNCENDDEMGVVAFVCVWGEFRLKISFFYYTIVVTADLKKRERNDDGEGLWRVFVILWLAIMTRKLTTAGRWGRVWARHESISYWFFSASICRIFYERFEYISHPSRRANSTWRERELFGREFYCKYRQSRLIYLHGEERERVVKIKHCQQSA